MSEIDRDSKLDRDRVIIRLSNKEIERAKKIDRQRGRERETEREKERQRERDR